MDRRLPLSKRVRNGHRKRNEAVRALPDFALKRFLSQPAAVAARANLSASFAEPAIAGNRVFVGSNDGKFYVLNLATGAKLWEFNAGAPLSASPAIANGRVVIGSQDGRLYCFG